MTRCSLAVRGFFGVRARTLGEFTERAQTFGLVGEEWDAWDQLQNIAFLLGDGKS